MADLKAYIPVQVRYGETDQMGVVHHVNYLNYFEIARTELLRKCGYSYKEIEAEGVLLAVTEAYCKYLKPAQYDDNLVIETWISLLKTVRIQFEYQIFREEEKLAYGFTKLGCLSKKFTPMALPEHFSDKLFEYYCEEQTVKNLRS